MLEGFFQIGLPPKEVMEGHYDQHLVFLSYVVAVFASYVALNMISRLRDIDNDNTSRVIWLVSAAFAMGAGIWSMHFIGMLAFKMSMPMSYDWFLTSMSLVLAMIPSGFALYLIQSDHYERKKLLISGIILGFAISMMHYTGMEAMKITMTIHYKPLYFVFSIIVAILVSYLALWFAIQSNQKNNIANNRLKIISALIMGVGICSMHYTGMEAAIFTPKAHGIDPITFIDPNLLTLIVSLTIISLLTIGLSISNYKGKINKKLELAHSIGMAEVAENVLHNVGNVLNTINVSATIISERINNFEFNKLDNIHKLLVENDELILQANPKLSKLPTYIKTISNYWEDDKKHILKELSWLSSNLNHVKDIISSQQKLSHVSGVKQRLPLDSVVEEGILLSGVNIHNREIQIIREFDEVDPLLLNKIAMLQVIVNMMRNARDALMMVDKNEKFIRVVIAEDEKNIILRISDNGVGIPRENMKKIFTHGFTTKKSGHGFGLHASAIALKEMNCRLEVVSNTNEGATFTLFFMKS